MINSLLKNKAIYLRKKGNSLNEISQKLNIPKSTVSIWCRHTLLNPRQIQRLVKKQKFGSYKGRMRFLKRIRVQKIEEVKRLKKKGLDEVGKLNKRDLFIAGVAMYWSEGYTYSGGEQVGFTNSDPKMILFILKWLEKICEIPKTNLALQVKINKIHKNRIREVERFWSNITKIHLGQFNKTVLIQSKVKKYYLNYCNHYGTLRITVHKGTSLRRKINGWIEGLTRGLV